MITIRDISKKFENKVLFDSISFSFSTESILSIVGKSGCGKTTLLKILAGIEHADVGSFFIHQQNMFSISPKNRNVVYLSQEPLLFPHLNTFENIAFGLKIRKVNRTEITKRVNEILIQLELIQQSQQMPSTLSGGQKQRVAFGRALIINPNLLLLDEPFTGLDNETRQKMRTLFKTVVSNSKTSSIWVTHDFQEAILMGDSFALLQEGKIKKFDTANDFVNANYTLLESEINFWDSLKKNNKPK